MPVTILLVDEYPIVREGLKTVLGGHEDLHVVGETGYGAEAIELAARLLPNVLIVGDLIPVLSSREVIRQVCQRVLSTRVVVLSKYTNATYVLEIIRSGAAGYILKRAHVTELVQAVRAVAAGRRYISPALGERIIRAQRAPTDVLDPYETLTTREREVLLLVAEGHTNIESAAILGISSRTVESHRARLMRKLGLRSPIDLIRYALQRGILPTEQ